MSKEKIVSLKSEKKEKMMFELFYNKRKSRRLFWSGGNGTNTIRIPGSSRIWVIVWRLPIFAVNETAKNREPDHFELSNRKWESQRQVDFLRLILSFDANQFWLALEARLLLLYKPRFHTPQAIAGILVGFRRERLRKLESGDQNHCTDGSISVLEASIWKL